VTVTPKVGILNLKVGNEVVIENVSENEYNGRFIVTSVVAGSNDNIARAFTYELASTSTIANPTLSSNNSEEVLFKSETSGNSYYFEYYDDSLGYYQIIPTSSFIREVTNYQHEERLEDDKRNIYILKPTYLNVIFNDIEEIMSYKKGGDQYLTPTLKKGDNIRLYE
jgi:hypothetical protein